MTNLFKYSDTEGYKLKYRILGIPRNIKKRIKYCYQRCTKGYCDMDAWNIDISIANLLGEMLKGLAENGSGFPGRDEMDSSGKWKKALKDCAEDLAFCITDSLDDPIVQAKEKERDSWIENNNTEYKDAEDWVHRLNNPVYKDVNKYTKANEEWKKALEEAEKQREEARKRAFEFLKKWWNYLWD